MKCKDGHILIPLYKRGRGRPRNPSTPNLGDEKNPIGRPRKRVDKVDANSDVSDDNAQEKGVGLDLNDNTLECGTVLNELRILGSDHILSKVFVSEALVCDDPIETHIYDILGDAGKALPCYYCGDLEQKNLFSLQTDEHFPLCHACQKMGRGHGLRRKSRAIKTAAVKPKKKPKQVSKKSSKRKVFID